MLYTVKYTTRREVTKYGPKREVLSVDTIDVPITMRDLPESTARSYAGCENFSMEKQFRTHNEPVTFRKRDYAKPADTTRLESARSAPKKPKVPTAAELAQEAARTGDMSHAINGG